MKVQFTIPLLLYCVTGMTVALVGCGGGDDDTQEPTSTPTAGGTPGSNTRSPSPNGASPTAGAASGDLALSLIGDIGPYELYDAVEFDGSIIGFAGTTTIGQMVMVRIDPESGELTAGPPLPVPASSIFTTDAGLFLQTNGPCGVAPVDPAALTMGEINEFPDPIFGCEGMVVIGDKAYSILYGQFQNVVWEADTSAGTSRTLDVTDMVPRGYESVSMVTYDGVLFTSFDPPSGTETYLGMRIDPEAFEASEPVELTGSITWGDSGPIVREGFDTYAVNPVTLEATPTDEDSRLAVEVRGDGGATAADGTHWLAAVSYPGDPEREVHVRRLDADFTVIDEVKERLLPMIEGGAAQRVVAIAFEDSLFVAASTNRYDAARQANEVGGALLRVE